ncbi:MAG: hypothetical protein HY074_13525 [Deltaproteobacteria bacterium]|nr:hypothetical protein [Deltaproteobacteria bacterium]
MAQISPPSSGPVRSSVSLPGVRRYALILLALGFFCAGKLMRPFPADPDSAIGPMQVLGTGCLFGFWLVGVCSWGRIFRRACLPQCPDPGLVLGLGTAAAAFFAMLLGHLGLIGARSEPAFDIALALGLLLDAGGNVVPAARASRSWELRGWKQWLALLPWLVLCYWALALVLKASIPHFQSDPLLQHLLGPRLWFQDGAITLNSRIPVAMKNYYWEYLSIWANSLLGGEAGRGLVESQIFSQWLHVLAWFGTLLILIPLLRYFSVPWPWLGFGILAAASSWSVAWTAELAKNDWGVIFWTLCGLRLLLAIQGPELRNLFIGGLFLGLAVGAKFTAAITIAPFVAFWAAKRLFDDGFSKGFRAILFLSGAFSLGLTPILMRNFILTENPFFPILDGIFSSPRLSRSVARYYAASQWADGREFGSLLAARVKLIAVHEPALIALFLAGIAVPICWKRRGWNSRTPLYFVSAAAVMLFLVSVGANKTAEDGNLALRLMGPGMILGLSSGVFAFFDVFLVLSDRFTWLISATGIVITIFGISQSRLPLIDLARTRYSIANLTDAMRTIAIGGATKAWLRLNASPEDLIVTTGDNQLYYVAHLRVTAMPDQPGLDRSYNGPSGFEDYLEFLLSLGTKYILDSSHYELGYWSDFSYELNRRLRAHPEAVIFERVDSRIVAPQELFEGIKKSCSKPRSRLPDFEALDI